MLQGLVANQGDGWKWMLEELERYYESYGKESIPEEEWIKPAGSRRRPDQLKASEFARDHAGVALDAAAVLGRRTAEMHRALACSSANPAFAPEPLTAAYLEGVQSAINAQALQAYELLKKNLSLLADDTVEMAAYVLSGRTRVIGRLNGFAASALDGLRTRIHGDYHLGQVLRVKTDFFILDFEGEPARPLEMRRAKHSPLKDVAGMLRSFNYAAWAALIKYSSRRPGTYAQLEPWARMWDRSTTAEFLRAYCDTMSGSGLVAAEPATFYALLDLYLLEKAFYELVYELNSRPDWVKIPLTGIASLLE